MALLYGVMYSYIIKRKHCKRVNYCRYKTCSWRKKDFIVKLLKDLLSMSSQNVVLKIFLQFDNKDFFQLRVLSSMHIYLEAMDLYFYAPFDKKSHI